MKFSLVAVVAAAVAAVSVDAAQVHIRVHSEKAGACPAGQFYDGSKCRQADHTKGECYNPATNKFQIGCAKGFICVNSKCDWPANANNGAGCWQSCPSGQYCEKSTNVCRGPISQGECFNYAIGYYQIGCDAGFECRNNKCDYKQGGGNNNSNNNNQPAGWCLNPATGKYIPKCDPGFVCRNGKCDYA
ncbi:hypothetical protein FI667_g8103, partial [Globisporangium splendens]